MTAAGEFLGIKILPIPEPLASLHVVDEKRVFRGRFADVIQGFVVSSGESLVEAATRALPAGWLAYFPPEWWDSSIQIEGRKPHDE